MNHANVVIHIAQSREAEVYRAIMVEAPEWLWEDLESETIVAEGRSAVRAALSFIRACRHADLAVNVIDVIE